MLGVERTVANFTLRIEGLSYPGRIIKNDSRYLPIFFLNGAFQSMASWKKFVEFFAPGRTVILSDLPGTGAADPLPRERGFDFLARAARAVLDHCGIGKAHLVSASYGSPIAYRLCQLFPERIQSAVLAGVMRKIPEHVRQPALDTIRSLEEGRMKDFARQVVDRFLCRDPSKPIARGALARRLLLSQLERMPEIDRRRYRENTLRLLHHAPLDLADPPRVPVLVFTGEHDVLSLPGACREIAAALPDAAFTTLREADHLFHVEQLENTLALLNRFLNGLPLEGSPGCNAFELFNNRGRESGSDQPQPQLRGGKHRFGAVVSAE
jgi:pimeloyl-ACP methyl ester carboxylesterase